MNFEPGTESTYNLQFNFCSLLPPGELSADRAKAAIIEFLVKRYGLETFTPRDYYAGYSFITQPRYNGSAKVTFYRTTGVAVEAESKTLAAEILDGIVDAVLMTKEESK